MKRCPACKRVENDDTLAFCRADGTALVSDSSSLSSEAGTAKLGATSASTQIETSVLAQHATDAGASRRTGPSTVLPAQRISDKTLELSKPKWLKVVVAVLMMLIEGDDVACGYFYI